MFACLIYTEKHRPFDHPSLNATYMDNPREFRPSQAKRSGCDIHGPFFLVRNGLAEKHNMHHNCTHQEYSAMLIATEAERVARPARTPNPR
jgi:hypothetical protein